RALSRAEGYPGLLGEVRGRDVEQGELDLLAAAGAGAGEQRQDDAVGRGHAGDEVRDRVTDLHGRTVRESGEVHDARLGLDHEVVAGAVRFGPGFTEARDRAVHEPRVQPREGAV